MPRVPSTLAVLVLALGCAVAAAVLSPAPAASRSSGANPGFAGERERADGSPQTCAVCHDQFALDAGPGGLAIEAPASVGPSGRVPITIALDAEALQTDGRQGFEATIRDPETKEAWGTLHLVDAVDTRFATGDASYVTHTTSGTARAAWTFEWDPDGRAGTARVYVAANAADNDGDTGGDYVYTATADVAVSVTAGGEGPEAAVRIGTPRPHPARIGAPAWLDVTLDRPAPLRVRLLDARGRVVRTVADGDRAAGTAALALDTAGLAAGVYAVEVTGPGGRRTRPLVVVR